MERGSALIDSLVAVAVVAMGVLGFSSASLHLNTLRKAGLQSDAASVALLRQAEVMRAADFGSLMGMNEQSFAEPCDIDHDGELDTSLIRVTEEQPGLLRVDLSLEWGRRERRLRAQEELWITDRRTLGE